MLTIAYYFLQVVLCSGMMMGYYWLVLRNKRFHQYNRFYLLAIAALSWIVPLVKIKWGHTVISEDPQMMRFLSVVADNNSQIEESLSGKGFQWSWDMLAPGIYVVVALVLLFGMLRALYRIYRLLQIHSCKNVGDIYLIVTEAKGTPFSFFRYIFWNNEIDIRSEAGKQILQHELTHVQQKHSFDKLFIQSMLIEMEMIHEFIADNKAVANGDTASLAQMLLTAAYPQQRFLLTHPFFFSPIKRRLQMLTNKSNPRFSYLRRLVVLPLLAVVVVLFAFRNKDRKTTTTISVAAVMEKVADKISDLQSSGKPSIDVFDMAMLNRTYTVIIDAGHGGKDKGMTATDGTTEAELNLQMAKTIRDLNENEKIHIVLRRETDIYQTAASITEMVNQQMPDLYISLHTNGTNPVLSANGNARANPATGIEMYVPVKAKATDYEGSAVLANYLNASLSSLKEKMRGIKSREKGLVVLDNVKSPAVLIETGFLSNEADLKKLKDAAYQKQMAQAVLQAINTYLSKQVQNKLNLEKLGMDTVIIKQKGKEDEIKLAYTPNLQNGNEKAPLYFVDGKKMDKHVLETISPNDIDRVDVLKGETAKAKYGEDGMNGVVLITTKEYSKKKPLWMVDGKKIDDYAWNTLSPDRIDKIDILKDSNAVKLYGEEAKNGVVLITTKEYALAQKNKNTVSSFLTTDEKGDVSWKSIQYGAKDPLDSSVKIKTEPNSANEDNTFTIKISNANTQSSKVYTIVQTPAEFPGGLASWTKYLERNLHIDIVKKNGGPPGKYTVVVSFMVDKQGGLSDIKALNDPGYGTKDEAIRLIAKGPKWKPAMQNGHVVNSVHKQSITFYITDDKAELKIIENEPDKNILLTNATMLPNFNLHFYVKGKDIIIHP
jgi:TonB-dependent SusC/RagA subfamily outer membrane receptor